MATNEAEIRARLRGESPSPDLASIRNRLQGKQEPCPEGQHRDKTTGECVVERRVEASDAAPTDPSIGPRGRRIADITPDEIIIQPEPDEPFEVDVPLNEFTQREIARREAVRARLRGESDPKTPSIGPSTRPLTEEIRPPEPGPIGRNVQRGLVALGNTLTAAKETPSFVGAGVQKLDELQRTVSNLARQAMGREPLDDDDLERLDRQLQRMSEEFPATAMTGQIIGTMAPIVADLVAFKRAAGAAAGQTTGRTSRVLESLSRWSQPTALQSAGVALGEEAVLQAGLAAAGQADIPEAATGAALAATLGAAFPGGRAARAVYVDDNPFAGGHMQFFEYMLETADDRAAPVAAIFDRDTRDLNLDIADLVGRGELGPGEIRQLARDILDDLEGRGVTVETVSGFRTTGANQNRQLTVPADRLRGRTEAGAGAEESAAYIEYQRGASQAAFRSARNLEEGSLRAAAVRVDGEVSEGSTHADALKRAGYDPDDMFDEFESGFTDMAGVFHPDTKLTSGGATSEAMRAGGALPIGRVPEGGYRSRVPDRRPGSGGESVFTEVLTRNTSSKNPWRITQLRNSEPVFHQEFGSYDEARRALNELADEHNAVVKPIEGQVVTKDQLLNDPRAGFLLMPDPAVVAQRVKQGGAVLADFKIPQSGGQTTSLRREFAVEGDLPKPIFEQMVRNNAKIRSEVGQMEFILREMDRSIDEAVQAGAMEEEFADMMINTALSAKGREALLALPVNVRPAVEAARAHIDALTQRGIDLGLFAGDRTSTYVRNQGIYMNRAYEAHANPRWARENIDPAVVNQAKSYLRTQPAYADLTNDQLNVVIDRILYQDEISPMVQAARSRLGSKDLTVMRQRFLDARPIRELLGEFEGGRGNYARSVYRMSQLVENHNFLTEAREAGLKGGWFSHEEALQPGHVTQIAAEGSEVMSPLNGLYTTPEIKRAFEDALDLNEKNEWPAIFMKAVGTVKYMKTVGSVQTHVRNVTSAAGFALANGHLNPAALKTWRNLNLAMSATAADLGRAGPTGGFQQIRGLPGEIPADEVVDIAARGNLDMTDGGQLLTFFNRLQELGVTYDGARFGEFKDVMNDAFTNRSPIEYLERQAGRRIDKFGKAITDLYRAEDDVWKVHGFLSEYQKWRQALPDATTRDIEDIAAASIREGYPTYSLVPRGVKRIRRIPFIGPFVSFSAEIIRTAANVNKRALRELQGIDPRTGAPATDPEVFAAIQDIGRRRVAGIAAASVGTSAVVEAGRQMTGISRDTDQDYREFLPPWSKNGHILWLQQDQDNGRLQYIDLSYSDPYNYLKRPLVAILNGDDVTDATLEAMKELAEPFFGADILTSGLAEVMTAYMSDGSARGQRIVNLQADPLTQLGQVTDHLWQTIEPGTITTLKRTAKGFNWITDENGRAYDGVQELIAAGLGLRISTVDIPQALFFRARDLSNALSDARGLLATEAFRRGPHDPGDLAGAFEDSDTARRGLYEEFSKIVHAARVFGMNDRDIRRKIQEGSNAAGENRLSDAEIRDIMRGRYHVWVPRGLPRSVPGSRDRERQLRDLRRGSRGTGIESSVPATGTPDPNVDLEEIRRRLRGEGNE